jgi:hypothetical protein
MRIGILSHYLNKIVDFLENYEIFYESISRMARWHPNQSWIQHRVPPAPPVRRKYAAWLMNG